MKARIVEFSVRLWQRAAFLRSGIGLVCVVVALVGLRLLWIQLQRPVHRQEIAKAFGSVSLFYGAQQFNHEGSKFTYTSTSERGYGLFLCDTATGQKQMIHEELVQGAFRSSFAFYAWPWSPDDSAFIYCLHDQLIIHPADTNKPSAQITIGNDAVSDLVWLTPAKFAYVSFGTNLCYAERQADGEWQQHDLLHGNGMASLTAVDTNTVAWLQDGLICRLDLAKGLDATSNLPTAGASDTNALPSISGLTLWLDASTLHQADQTPVTGLADLSSSRNDAVPNANPPLYNAPESSGALNGKGTIHFTAGDSLADATGLKTLAKLGISGNVPRTVFAVMYHDASGGVKSGDMRISIGDANARFGYFGLEENYNSIYLPKIWNNRWANRVVMRSPAWGVWEVVYDGAIQSAYLNGTLKGTNNVRVQTVDKEVEIGFRSASASGTNAVGANGNFAELLIYNRALETDERQQVENYLKMKWLNNNVLSTKSPLVWCNPQMNGITGFIYSKENGQFLLRQTENKRDLLWQFNPQTAETSKIAEAASITGAQWIGKSGYAYGISNSGTNKVMVFGDLGARTASSLEQGDFRSFQTSSDGGKLLLIGTFSNEPAAGIWQYDIGPGQLRSMVSGSGQPSAYAINYAPSSSTIKLPSGKSVKCTIYPPANFNPHKKYPLVIGYTSFGTFLNGSFGRLWLPAIATCGAYVVVVNRPSWDDGIEFWEENVTGACKSLLKNPNIDFQQVYVFAASKETSYLDECITKSPKLWKGAILLNPGELPDFSKSPMLQQRPKILITAGGEEHEDARFKKYQQDSLQSGVMVDVVISPDATHFFVGNAAQLERTMAIMHFIFEE